MNNLNEELVQLAKEWHEKLIRMLTFSAKKHKVKKTGKLQSSIKGAFIISGSNIIMEVEYALQGGFVDMGTRKGVKANTKKEIRKLWLSPILFGSTTRLQRLCIIKVSHRVIHTLATLEEIES